MAGHRLVSRWRRQLVRLAGVTLLVYGLLAGVSAFQMLSAAVNNQGYGLAGAGGSIVLSYAVLCVGLAIPIILGFDRIPLLVGFLVTGAVSAFFLAYSNRPSPDGIATVLVALVLFVGLVARWIVFEVLNQ
jgi:hypothetical protein